MGKDDKARSICRLQQDILKDYDVYSFDAFRRSVKAVLQAIELKEFTWSEHREILFTCHELTRPEPIAIQKSSIGIGGAESSPVQKP